MRHNFVLCDVCGLQKDDTQKLTFQQLQDLDVCQADWDLYVAPFLASVGPVFAATQAMFKQRGWK